MQGNERLKGSMKDIHVFGIRHLSPGGAYHLRAFLDEVKPHAILIEGPSDANDAVRHITNTGTKPPAAILSYTEELPVRTLLYPLADYSPEYQALLWGRQNSVNARFFDLPSGVMMALEYAGDEEDGPKDCEDEAYENIYEAYARAAGERDYESYWERNFEHNLSRDSYRRAIWEFSKGMRSLSEERERVHSRKEYEKNMIREAFMRKGIMDALEEGHEPGRIVVITGAYHSSVMDEGHHVMTEEEFLNLPRVDTKLTLMPYSYFKLSSMSGYGAGNNAPAYYEMMWERLVHNDLESLPSYYLANVASALREGGTYRSPAEVIEGVRLAGAMAYISSGGTPVLRDLRDAAVTSLGQGSLSVVSEALARMEVGTAIGSLPEGVSQTPVQDDFNRELKRLKLEKYKSAVAQDVELDLRENRRVKSADAAFLDLNRSFFLHRLRVLNISFAKFVPVHSSSSSWAEHWILKWSPQAEIEMVESTLKGETVERAASFVFKERLETCREVREASQIIAAAARCGMMESMEQAKTALQGLSVDSADFVQAAGAAREMSAVISYGDIRRFDGSRFIPLMEQLFLRGCLVLMGSASCSDDASGRILEAINDMNLAAMEHYNDVDDGLWVKKLDELSNRDDKNPRLSGYACSILLERNLISSERLSQEVSRRLSPGIDAGLGAGWFEGLSMRNRYALLSRISLWEKLSEYVASLDDEQFKRALVFLRRAFGSFEPSEKSRIGELLGEVWGINALEASDYLNRPMPEDEQERLEGLNEFDFGDI
jgi:hypothetical protein